MVVILEPDFETVSDWTLGRVGTAFDVPVRDTWWKNAGTNSATFKINQDNAGVEASAIEFDRGSVATAARILWSEANDWFSFEEVTGSTKTTIDAAKLQVSDGVNLDGSTGTIKISEDDATGDMVLQVASGDAIVFKAV